ncbi:zinc finger MYM-type protein 1-like [Aphis craccivora]|uniref:Zinc finger MYM-type protein 1-like n=1 Tax=Aphis craccivora TaxID=307492 RepID=A0A6G0VT64_APHCR|nr:zinc finger MYM-type protein 1-like [Aphis craccivora]
MQSTLSSSLKPVKMQNRKRKNDTEPKQQTEPIETYKDALASIISKGNIEDNVSNSIIVTEGNYTTYIPSLERLNELYIIKNNHLMTSFPAELLRVFYLFLILLVTVVSAERSFSKLNILTPRQQFRKINYSIKLGVNIKSKIFLKRS